jgi:G:T-mismatch repair DNA endonuclease (very short patch repair protein)
MSQLNGAATQGQEVCRAEGQTPSERYLKELCDKAFLSLWSYPGVYRDQRGGGVGSKQEGKEVCDLLVVFDKHIIIFSDKHCRFSTEGRIETSWRRWFRSTVIDSARQVRGAERWIRNYPNRLFLDRKCTNPLPIAVPNVDTAVFHRIVVAHGISQACREVMGGSGSLMLTSDVVGVAQHDFPFRIGWPDGSDNGFIHVFDDATLYFVLRTLDTVTDFVSYLTKKEAFFQSGRKIAAAGEEELLAWYLGKLNADGEHDFVVPGNYDAVVIDEGFWERFSQHPQRLAQVEANRTSYAWDMLIEKFSRNIMRGTEYFASGLAVKNQEVILRFMARENRTRRRLLAEAIIEILGKTAADDRAARIVQPSYPGDPYYVLVLLHWPVGMPEKTYREARKNLLSAYCQVVKVVFPDAQHIVGIATESGRSAHRSEDAIYLNASHWTDELQRQAEEIRQDLSLFRKMRVTKGRVSEYPSEPKVFRNSKCPCGSGKKYKQCHGRPPKAKKM